MARVSQLAGDQAQALERRIAAGGAREALDVVRELARHTPLLTSGTLTQRCGGRIVLKAENLQRTGSFKLRGALAKLATLEGSSGVVAGSAGNHAQSLAYAAQARGVPCEVFMPREAPVAKVAAVGAYGGSVVLEADSVDHCLELAVERAAATGATFVHPFDDPEVILGQATLGVELLDDVDDLACVVVPIGGGGLASGVGAAIKLARPEVAVIGVQVEASAAFPPSLAAGEPLSVEATSTIADGIAVKRPGRTTLALVERFVDEICVVGEDEVAEAMVLLMERAKLVVEGAGAVGVAALLAGAVAPARSGTTVALLSGGNVDAGLLALVAQRHEAAVGRRLRIATAVSDRPGGLAALLTCVADTGANLITVEHVRDAADLHVRQTAVELTLETRGSEHAETILAALAERGYRVDRLG
ncbi:MAG TPA: threonine ammonia-lyase [Solirubrobacteraceae bacterium]|nr:threonine ammonia-lyase [Solirubrobacteraceae bacterium]